MSESIERNDAGTPWHLWVVGIVALLWNAMGALDYVMTQTQNPEYMAQFSPEQLEFFYGFPIWVEATWAIAIWGAILGCILLLMRKGLAAPVFLVSWLAMVVTSFHNFVLSNGFEIMGDPFSLAFTAVIFLVALALFLYARAMRSRGVLA